MTSSSVSFRISRHTQDLAETVHALSQRLVSLEQRLLSLEGQLQAVRQQPRQAEEKEAANLAPIEAHIDRLLQDCRQLLADQPPSSVEDAAPVRTDSRDGALPFSEAAEAGFVPSADPYAAVSDDGDIADADAIAALEAA